MVNTQSERVVSPMTAPEINKFKTLDFSFLKRKMMDSNEGESWTEAQCNFAIAEYLRFLMIVLKFGNAVPNRIMDTVWHYHILDTRAYARDCETIFGEFVHHYPYFGLNGEEDYENLLKDFELTQTRYEQLFGEKIDRKSELFDANKAGYCSKCKGICSRCNNG